MTDNNVPGTSPVYAIARDMLAQIGKGVRSYTANVGTLYASLHDGGDYRSLILFDGDPIHPDTLALWAVAFGVQSPQWSPSAHGRVARLEWATDGEPATEGGAVTWIGQVR